MKLLATAAVALLVSVGSASAQVQPASQDVTLHLSADKLDTIGLALLDSIKLSIAQNPEADVSAKQNLLKDIRVQYHDQTDQKPDDRGTGAVSAEKPEHAAPAPKAPK